MKLSDSDKKERLRVIMRCMLSGLFDDQEMYLLTQMGNKTTIDPYWMDYIFSKKYGMTVDEAAEKAMNYKAIRL